MAENAMAWAASEAGQKAMEENLKLIAKAISDLTEARRVDEENLHEPFTL